MLNCGELYCSSYESSINGAAPKACCKSKGVLYQIISSIDYVIQSLYDVDSVVRLESFRVLNSPYGRVLES